MRFAAGSDRGADLSSSGHLGVEIAASLRSSR
jgi:hypothetical protein